MSLIVNIEKKLDHMVLRADFSVEQEVLSLFGVSGSGKSMILKCIAGLETPDRGRIVLNGRVLFDSDKKINVKPQQRKAGYVFQNYALFPNMTVAQNIGFAVCKSKRKQVVAEMIQKFRLDGLEDTMPSKLSGGQRQRVSIARMLAAKPELILLDEPFSALDHQLVKELIHEMKEVLENAVCPVIFVSHNREEVYQLSSRLGVIEHGKLGGIRPTKEVFEKPDTMEEAKLCGCDNIIRMTPEVKKKFGLTHSFKDDVAIGIYSDDIRLSKGSNNELHLTGNVVSIVEEISRIRYEVIVKELSECRMIVSRKKESNGMRQSIQVGDVIQLFLAHDALHLLKKRGNK